jgi:hypothetical protein
MESDMPAVMIALNILFALGVVVVIAGGLLVAMATQHRDHGVIASGPVLRRHVWSPRGPRPHAGPVRPWIAREGEVWPAA